MSFWIVSLFALFYCLSSLQQSKIRGDKRNKLFPQLFLLWYHLLLVAEFILFPNFQKTTGHRLVRNCIPVISPTFEIIRFKKKTQTMLLFLKWQVVIIYSYHLICSFLIICPKIFLVNLTVLLSVVYWYITSTIHL